MPELADIEGWKRYVARYVEGRRVLGVHARDPEVLRNTSPQGLGRALKRRRLGSPSRHGKWLRIPAGGGSLVIHFGMTGALEWTSTPAPAQGFDRVIFDLEGGELRYRAQRKLGGLWWISAQDDPSEVTGPLGPDAAAIDKAGFHRLLSGRRGGIKSALMDQEALAGLGNELSDEILWRARIRPDAKVPDLFEGRIDDLWSAMRDVLRSAMKHGRIPEHGRWLNAVRGEDSPRCPRCGGAVERSKAAGRTAYWCPRCQR